MNPLHVFIVNRAACIRLILCGADIKSVSI
jgi:hypothetical protein